MVIILVMAHLRSRQAQALLQRKLKFSRVVSIQGARQTGKSVLARDLFSNGIYTTLDQSKAREEALVRSGVFIETLVQRADRKKTIVIDEAQKAPPLFDEIKSVVDVNPAPGQFLLLGPTEFSHETKVLESLTGRISRLRLYPLTLTETLSRAQSDMSFLKPKHEPKATRAELVRYLRQGGFPSVFSVRNDSERRDKLNEWLTLTCERDVMQVLRMKARPDLCLRILELLPVLEEPTVASIASKLKRTGRSVEAQLKILKLIFAVHELKPHPISTGKPLYYLIDPSLVGLLGGSFERMLETALLTELLAKAAYIDRQNCRLSFYRTAKGSRVHFLLERNPLETIALKMTDSEKLDLRDSLILESLQKKMKNEGIHCSTVLAGGVAQRSKLNGHLVLPWEYIF